MATITPKKNSKNRSVQEMEYIEGFSSEPFFISDTDLNTLKFDSIEFAADGTAFTSITAYDSDGSTYDYIAQCNMSGLSFDKGDSPLISPNGFASIQLASGSVKLNR